MCIRDRPKVGSYSEWACYGPNGKTEATQSSLIHFTDAPMRVKLRRERGVAQTFTAGACCSRAWLTQGYHQRRDSLMNYERKRGEQPCQEVSPQNLERNISSIKCKGHKRSNNCSKMADFRLKSRYLKKLLTDLNDFWLRRSRMQVASLNLKKDIIHHK